MSDTTDHVYWNGYVNNNTTRACPLSFNQQVNLNFIKNPAEWEMSIIKFSIPSTIPYFLFNQSGYIPTYTDTTRSFSLIKTDGAGVATNYTANCIFSSSGYLSSANAYLYEQNNIYEVLRAFNTAISTVWVAAGLLLVDAPNFTYSPTTQLLSLNLTATAAGILQNTQTPPTTAISAYQLYCSWTLYDLFQSFNVFGYQGIPYSVSGGVEGNYNTLFRFPAMSGSQTITQEYSTISMLSKIKSIVITTNSLPVLAEEFPDFKVNSNLSGLSFMSSNTSNKRIVSEFSLGSEPRNAQNEAFLNYLPTAEYRMIDLTGSAPIKNIDFNFEILSAESTNTTSGPFYLLPNQSASIKVLFRKRK